MKHLSALAISLFVTAGCSDPDDRESKTAPDYATQLGAPSPDYAAMEFVLPEFDPGEGQRAGVGPVPANAKALGELWYARLAEDGMIGGLAPLGGPDGPISMMDLNVTEDDFEAWLAQFDEPFPPHIYLYFEPRLFSPSLTEPARSRIRYWPASERRTGMQNMAALGGRVVIRDGCFFFLERGEDPATAPFDRLAWFLAETGLDVDAEGYLVLIDRQTGHLQSRVGETMGWAGPNAVVISDEQKSKLFAACGEHEIVSVGNPQADEKTYVEYPHARPSPITSPPPRSSPPPPRVPPLPPPPPPRP